MRSIAIIICAASCFACATAAPAPDEAVIEVMVLGSFHMGNPGQDVVNSEIESMLTPQRQAEIADVSEALGAFHPTLVAVERITAAPDYLDPKFAAFTPDALTVVADERYQLAYRLAHEQGLTRVYGIDEQPDEGEPDYFPYDRLVEHAAATGQQGRLNAAIEAVQQVAKDFEARQATATVGELLYLMNTELAGADFYYDTFRFDRGEAQPGAELQSYWFMRNAKIFSKLLQIAKPGDRVVVVFGAGHKYWLEHFAAHTPGVALVDVTNYLPAGK